jgi:hypothetical protein
VTTVRAASLAVLLGVGLTEGIVRLAGTRLFDRPLVPYDVTEPVVEGRKADPRTAYLVFDADLGWRVGAARTGRGGLYHSDARGLRRSGLAGVERIAAFGDSFTHGDDVTDGDTWIARLNERGLAVVNAGVPGYGVDQAWLRYRRLKKELSADTILIGVMADNIGRHVNRYRPFITPAERIYFVKPRFARNGDALELLPSPFGTEADYGRPADALRASLTKAGAQDRFFDPRFYDASPFDALRLARIARTLSLERTRPADWRSLYDDRDAVALTIAIVKGFADEVRADGRRPVVLFLPERTVTRDLIEGRIPPTAAFVKGLADLGVPLLDLSPQVSVFAKRPDGLAHFLPHYSADLSRAVADTVAGYIEKSRP